MYSAGRGTKGRRSPFLHAESPWVAGAQAACSTTTMRSAPSTGEPLPPAVRPMCGLWSRNVLEAGAAARQHAVVLWDTTSGDSARIPGRSDVDLLVPNPIRGTNGSIILMHANLRYAQQALPGIIAAYRARCFNVRDRRTAPGNSRSGPVPAMMTFPTLARPT